MISRRFRWIFGLSSRVTHASSPVWRGSSAEGERSLTDLEGLLSASRALRSRYEDFQQALDRRDIDAYRLALDDFHRHLVRWTRAEEEALLPAILRAGLPGRDPSRELKLQWVQVRELTRYLLEQVDARAPIGDVLGFAENLAR